MATQSYARAGILSHALKMVKYKLFFFFSLFHFGSNFLKKNGPQLQTVKNVLILMKVLKLCLFELVKYMIIIIRLIQNV